MTFAEKFIMYQWYMTVLSMSREQIDNEPLAMKALMEIKDFIDEDPLDPITEGLRPRVERLLGPQQWAGVQS
jgi:hypothetical protein